MDRNFESIFQDVRHERTLILILAIIEPQILDAKFSLCDVNKMTTIAKEKILRRKMLVIFIYITNLFLNFSNVNGLFRKTNQLR